MHLPGSQRRCTCPRCAPLNQRSVNPKDPSGNEGSQKGASGAYVLPSLPALPALPTLPLSSVLIPAQTGPPATDTLPPARHDQTQQIQQADNLETASAPPPAPANAPMSTSTLYPIDSAVDSKPWSATSPASGASNATDASNTSNQPPILPTTVRQRVRHSFDVFADQILSLRDIALKRELQSGLHARLGDLVQEALDEFITREALASQTSQATRASPEPQRASKAHAVHDAHEARGNPDEHAAAGQAERPSGAPSDTHGADDQHEEDQENQGGLDGSGAPDT
jgi:hypothetical protein